MNTIMFLSNIGPRKIVPKKKKKEESIPPPPSKKQKPKDKEEETPKKKSELEKLTGRTAKEIPHLNEEIDPGEDEENFEGEEDDFPEEGGEAYSDKFLLNCEGLDSYRIKSIELPKMIFMRHKNEQSIKEKSSFMVYFYAAMAGDSEDKTRAPYPWKSLMEACKKDTIALSIDWLDAKGDKSSTWKFGGARIQGLDFGSAAYERPELAEAAIEIFYATINIDGIEF